MAVTVETPAGVPVDGTDGLVGTTLCVVIDPIAERVTHLVVRSNAPGHPQWLVPFGRLREATATAVRLNSPHAELTRSERFIEKRFIQLPADLQADPAWSAYDRVLWPYAALTSATPPVVGDALSTAELPIHRGDEVEAIDGPVGRVDEFLLDPTEHRVTHLVVPTGHLWQKHDALIPLSSIARIHDDTVTLTLDRHAVGALPSMPFRRAEELALTMAHPSLADLTPEDPDEAGVAEQEPDSAHIEGARLLANQAREALRARGFSDEQIREWAEAYISESHTGDVEGLLGWIRNRERHSGAAYPDRPPNPGFGSHT